jgi:hypothetical protein
MLTIQRDRDSDVGRHAVLICDVCPCAVDHWRDAVTPHRRLTSLHERGQRFVVHAGSCVAMAADLLPGATERLDVGHLPAEILIQVDVDPRDAAPSTEAGSGDADRALREAIAGRPRAAATLAKQALTPDQMRLKGEHVVWSTLAAGTITGQTAR